MSWNNVSMTKMIPYTNYDKLWTLRYRELKIYAYHSSVNRTSILAAEGKRTSSVKINWPDDELLKKNFPSLTSAKQNRERGIPCHQDLNIIRHAPPRIHPIHIGSGRPDHFQY